MTGAAVGVAPGWPVGLAAMLLVAAISLRFPKLALVAVLPAAYGARRLGPTAANLSLSDAVLLVGALVAIPFVPFDSPRLRRVLVGLVAYESILALAVVAHPTPRAFLEWGHRILIVAGALLVGSALARLGQHRTAIRFYLATSVFFALGAGFYSIAHHLAPAYPFGLQKNAAGLLLSFAFLITVVSPNLASIPDRLIMPVRVVLVLGVLATQSRTSMIATIVVLAAAQLRGSDIRRAAPFILLAALAMSAVTIMVTQRQDARARRDPSSSVFYGLGARQATNAQALAIWSHQRVIGSGLRYFRDSIFDTSEPHDVVVVSLAESGVIGLAALAALLSTSWLALRGLTGEVAALARLVFVVRFIAGLFDIFWVAGRGSFPWLIIGMAVGIHVVRPWRLGVPVT